MNADPKHEPESEEWFLRQLDLADLPVASLLQACENLRQAGNPDKADSWAEMLCDTLTERSLIGPALQALERRALWRGNAATEAQLSWGALAEKIVEKKRHEQGLVKHAGFEAGMPPVESIRRLMNLVALREGVLCLDNTWGFGVVRRVDVFYGRVVVDFEKKPEHSMSMAYAAEALQLLPEDHLLARWHRQPDAMRSLVGQAPAELVRLAIRSYGPLTAGQLQEILVPRLVAAEGWKTFWENARKELKKDPLFDFPAKRTEPLRLLDKAHDYDEGWFADLATERDMRNLIEKAEELVDASVELTESFRRILTDRLDFVVKGASGRDAGLVARALMTGAILKMDLFGFPARIEACFDPDFFQEATRRLPARLVNPFIRFLIDRDQGRAHALILDLLPAMNMVALNESLSWLMAQGRENECREIFREVVETQRSGVEMVYWMVRNPDPLAKWGFCTLPDLAHLVLLELAADYAGERLKVKNQLRSRFEQPDWWKPAFAAMNEAQRRDIFKRVRESPAWTALDRQSLLAQLIKTYPELQEVMTGRETETRTPAPRELVTSIRSFRERQEQLEKLIKVDIPQNSKEIAVARSYGDLSENHEFKAAKEMQGILLRRRGELEMMLHQVRSTDFENLPFETAGVGTGVGLRYPDGKKERYFILGEWDRDKQLGIISCTTRMAKALEGHRPGDEVKVPAETGESVCALEEVTGLTDEIRKWIAGHESVNVNNGQSTNETHT